MLPNSRGMAPPIMIGKSNMQPPLSITLVYTGTELFLANPEGEIWTTAIDIARTLEVDLPPSQGEREVTLIVPPKIGVPHNNPVFIPAPPPPPFCEGCAARIWWQAPPFVARTQHPLVIGGPLEVWELNLLLVIRGVVKARDGTIRDHMSQIIAAAAAEAAGEVAAEAAKKTVEETVEESPSISNILLFPRPKGRK
ncbi:MAG: hypothetical protein FD153_1347 [Rhodospirillaceae bacterium]|nr:MAG: hypothetical protein FD153_1347 [Rhodospirillaceae bacterium]